MNLWATLAQAAVYTTASFILTMILRRTAKRERERLERIASAVESIFGITTAPVQPLTVKESIVDIAARYKKGIAAGLGFIVTGILTWLASDGVLAALLDPIVPDTIKPLIGVLAGGLATVVAVIKVTNKPATETAPIETTDVQFAAVPAVIQAQTSPTSIVPLLPAPELSYL